MNINKDTTPTKVHKYAITILIVGAFTIDSIDDAMLPFWVEIAIKEI